MSPSTTPRPATRSPASTTPSWSATTSSTRAFGRITAQELTYWADPGRNQPGQINTRDGGRGVYFADPDGHLLEILTRPYGSGG